MKFPKLGGVPPELIGQDWTRDDAIAVMCRSLARLLTEWGQEGDAEAVRFAEHILRSPRLELMGSDELHALRMENDRLRNLIDAQAMELFKRRGRDTND